MSIVSKIWKQFIAILSLLLLSSRVMGADIPEGALLVKMKSKGSGLQVATAKEDLVALLGAKAQKNIGNFKSGLSLQASDKDNWISLEFETTEKSEEAKKILEEHEDVISVEPNYRVVINNIYDASQGYFLNTSLKELLDLPSRQEVVVAVIDTGVDFTHPNLRDAQWVNKKDPIDGLDNDQNGHVDDFNGLYEHQGLRQPIKDDNSHGTHMAGIIAARSIPTKPLSGFDTKAKIMAIKIFDANGVGTQADSAMAIRYAADMGAKIINCSWSYFKMNTVLREAVVYATQKGSLVVAAAGNAGSTLLEYPAAIPNVIAVGSVNNDNARSSFSSIGDHLFCSGYGESVYSSIPGGQYGFKSGTSQATAMLSGVLSKIVSIRSDITASEAKLLLQNSCTDLAPAGKDIASGYGVINGHRLAESLKPYLPKSQPSSSQSELNKTGSGAVSAQTPISTPAASSGFNWKNPWVYGGAAAVILLILGLGAG